MNAVSEPLAPAPAPILSMDAFIPPEMAVKAEDIGVKKAMMGWRNTIALAVLAGAFIALGAIFATTVTTGAAGQLTYGIGRLVGGLAFCLGLILVVVAGCPDQTFDEVAMPSVRVRGNEYFDAALRRFKRACEKAGVLTELRRREFYEKPTQERKRKKAAAVKRHQKRGMRDFGAPRARNY